MRKFNVQQLQKTKQYEAAAHFEAMQLSAEITVV